MFSASIAFLLFLTSAEVADRPVVVVVVGAQGTPEYAAQFHEWAERWRLAAEKAPADFRLIGDGEAADTNDHDQLKQLLATTVDDQSAPLWLVFIGHGTFDGRAAKFNLAGPDLTPDELAEWLKPIKRPIAVVQCASASAPFINRLAGENRIVIAATKNGDEQNFARFGQYISTAIADPEADVDKDGQVSLLEAYLTASRQVDEFYAQESRLATEHALLDDNGDGLGTPASWFRGVRATQRAKEGASPDGARAHQLHLIASDAERQLPAEVRGKRDALELELANLRADKGAMDKDAYYKRLERLLVQLAQLYEQAEK